MQLSLSARILWAAGFVELAALLLVLLGRGRWRKVPIFTIWIGFQMVRTMLLFSLYKHIIHASHATYAVVYWSTAGLDLALQIAIVFELARIVLKPTGTWVRDARRMFLLMVGVGTLIAAGTAYGIAPKVPNDLGDWIDKGSLFAAMLNAQLFAAMTLASTRLGLAWRHHVMAIASGWALWAVVGLFVEAAHSYFGPDWHGLELDQVRILTYQAVTIFWTINLWLPEPERRTLSPEMQAYLAGIQQQAQLGVSAMSRLDRR